MSTYDRFQKSKQAEEMRMFHCKDGLFFKREAESIRIIKTYDSREPRPDNVVMDITLTESEAASVFASMSRRGETSETYHSALAFITLQ